MPNFYKLMTLYILLSVNVMFFANDFSNCAKANYSESSSSSSGYSRDRRVNRALRRENKRERKKIRKLKRKLVKEHNRRASRNINLVHNPWKDGSYPGEEYSYKNAHWKSWGPHDSLSTKNFANKKLNKKQNDSSYQNYRSPNNGSVNTYDNASNLPK